MENYDFKKEIIEKFEAVMGSKKAGKAFINRLNNLKKDKNFENVFTCFEECPDNYIGEIDGEKFISVEDRYKAYMENKKTHKSGIKGEENIIILLESPHKDEFTRKFIAPALGETGERLNSYLEPLLKRSSIVGSKAKIFLVNAIQYQCSLGFPTKCVRNFVFNQLFDEDRFKKDLKGRIDKQHPKTILIVTTSFCRKKIKEWIMKEYKEVCVYEADSHPSVWTS